MIRKYLFILFLCLLFVWFVVAYLYWGDQRILKREFLWSAITVAAFLFWLIAERLIEYWRKYRARKTSNSAQVSTRPKALLEEETEFLALLGEAKQRLAQAPTLKGTKPLSLADLSRYLILGPAGAGKTAAFHCSGLEPALLAGQVRTAHASVASTRVSNLWLVNQSLFVEFGGHVFDGEPALLARLVRLLQDGGPSPKWKSWLRFFLPSGTLQGVVLFFDLGQFSGTPEPSKLDRSAQEIRERLFAIAEVAGSDFGVYACFTKADSLRYFAEFFERFSEKEADQVFGVLTDQTSLAPPEEGVWSEVETKRLNELFQSLSVGLGERRLLALAQEPDNKRKPAIYEFPREFKKTRTPLVQFLVDVFKPDPLRPGPRLRGFFLSGTRRTVLGDMHAAFGTVGGASEATQVFKGDPTVLASTAHADESRMFVKDFLNEVLRRGPSTLRRGVTYSRIERRRRIAAACAAGLAFFLMVVWTNSFFRNRELIASVRAASDEARRISGDIDLARLQSLDRLRNQVMELERNNSIGLHWGLYIGDELLTNARKLYFNRLKRLSLDRIHDEMAAQLSHAPTYSTLKVYRTITSRACAPDRAIVSKELKNSANETYPGLPADERDLLFAQLDFYTSEISDRAELPVPLSEDQAAEAIARDYLLQAGGPQQQLSHFVNDLNQRVKAISVAEKVPDYLKVLAGDAQVQGAYTKDGQVAFKDLIAKGGAGAAGEKCVLGESLGSTAQSVDAQTMHEVESLYYQQYADAWRSFLVSCSVRRFSDRNDAAQRLSILSEPQSPLLGVIRLIADNMVFPAPKPAEKSALEGLAQKAGFGGLAQAGAKTEEAAGQVQKHLSSDGGIMNIHDLVNQFNPVLYTTPPGDGLVNEHNKEYVNGLRALQESLAAMKGLPTEAIATTIPKALDALSQARKAQYDLADKFSSVGDGGLSKQLADLLAQPIQLADQVMPKVENPITKINHGLAQVCTAIAPVLKTFPFAPAATQEAEIPDVARAFGPNGTLFKYAQGSDLVKRNGQKWESGAAGLGLTVNPALLDYLNRAQQLSDALFGKSDLQPRFTYILRPIRNQSNQVVLVLDGKRISSADALQVPFSWPASSGVQPGASGTVVHSDGSTTPFGSYPTAWGVFRLFQNADSRPLGNVAVQWSQIRGMGNAAAQAFNPPAKIEFVDFSAGIDLFNPKFFEPLRQCPQSAANPN
jgi:type VI secretion system protein ImpL